MKKLLLALVVALAACTAAPAAPQETYVQSAIRHIKEEMHKVGKDVQIEDTGRAGEDGGPLVIVTIPGERQCLVQVHPKDVGLVAVLGCVAITEL